MLRVLGAQPTAEAWVSSPALLPLLARVAAHYRIGPEDVEDLAQETRIALWEAGAEPVGAAWVLRVASNKAVDLIRRRTKAVARDQAFGALPKGRTPAQEIRILLHARVALLPPRLRKFYYLHYVQGWSEREIAVHLGKCRASIRWLDRRCRRELIGSPAACATAHKPFPQARGRNASVKAKDVTGFSHRPASQPQNPFLRPPDLAPSVTNAAEALLLSPHH